jgi:hypothetical protein
MHIVNNEIQFDEDPYLFSFNNKLFDLKQNKFIEPKPEYYISLTCGYNFIERNEEDNKKDLMTNIFIIIAIVILILILYKLVSKRR